MKTIILESKGGTQNILQYGKELLDQLKQESTVAVYDEVLPDFSNVPELFDDSQKLVLFNQYGFKDGFVPLTQHLSSFKNVKYLLSPYAGYNGLDLELVNKLGIRYRNNAGANSKSVAQFAINCMFALLTKFLVLSKAKIMPDGSTLGEEYHNKTAGIIGMGNVGQEILHTLTGLGIQTTYFNRTKKNVDAKSVSLPDIFKQDLIFIAIAANPDTVALLESIPDLTQKHNYVIDVTAVDALYDKKKMLGLLNDDQLKGYAVELFKSVPDDFASDKNLVATPHVAWCTIDAEKRTVENYLNRALKILRGKASEVDFIV
jgi:D-3-phosphoglycerate dehydrogenase